MARSSKDMIEDFQRQRMASITNFGDTNSSRAHYRRWLDKYKRDLAEEESWLQTNPGNTIRQREVLRLRRQVAEYQKHYDNCGRNNCVFDEIKNVALQSDEGDLYPRDSGMISGAWGFRCCPSNQQQFEDFFITGDMKILSRKYEASGSNFVWENDRGTFKLIMCHTEDMECDEVFEVGYNGYMRKLSDEDIKSLRAEKRNKERKETEATLVRNREQASKRAIESAKDNSWINQNGHWLGWVVMIGFALWVINGVISHMP